MKKSLPCLLALGLFVAACGGDASEGGMSDDAMDGGMMSDEPIGSVSIDQPEAGVDVMGNEVTVSLSVQGFPIVQAGDMTPGTGHHHLFLDADVTPMGEPIPTVPGSIVHMGDGSSEYTFTDVTPGQHRLIAVVADGAHVPLNPPVMDTIMFTVN